MLCGRWGRGGALHQWCTADGPEQLRARHCRQKQAAEDSKVAEMMAAQYKASTKS